MSIEEILELLRRCADDGWFELNSPDAQTLLDYIRSLEQAAEDDRGVL